MDNKIDELLDDPCMSDQKWRTWLPVFAAAEAEYRFFQPTLPHSLVARVKRIIDNDVEEVET
ncbi:MAG: hypothetical protein Q8Q39_02675 [bacterium]|nr:hypothetical protein [bacterium]